MFNESCLSGPEYLILYYMVFFVKKVSVLFPLGPMMKQQDFCFLLRKVFKRVNKEAHSHDRKNEIIELLYW